MKKNILILISAIILSSCATTGGSIGNLFPAPKFLKGEIKNNVYIGKDNIFTITPPHKEESYEYKYMAIKEQYKPNNAYVSFGPAALNKSIYRVEVVIAPKGQKPNLNHASSIIESYSQQILKGSSTKPEIQETKKVKIHNHDAIYYKLTQDIPVGKYKSNSKAIFNHYAYVINYNYAVGVIWVQIPNDVQQREAGISHKEFANSLKIMPNK